jgi:acetyl esterase/lipase
VRRSKLRHYKEDAEEMASWQARVAVWVVKWNVKRRLRGLHDVNAARAVLKGMPFPVPPNVRVTSGEIGGVPVECAESLAQASKGRGKPPLDSDKNYVLLYFHGGGYFACSAKTHRAVTVTFAQAGFRVVAPNYRLAPECPFPSAVEDAVAVYRGLLDSGCEAERIAVAGDSAGGGLAAGMLLALRGRGVGLPGAAALFSPWLDLAATGESVRSNTKRCAMFSAENIALGAQFYLGGADARDPLASPLYGNLAGLPPMLIHVGEAEVLRDDSIRFAEKARAAGVRVELKVWPVVPHAWQLAPKLIPEARESLRAAAEFLTQRLGEVAPKRVGAAAGAESKLA